MPVPPELHLAIVFALTVAGCTRDQANPQDDTTSAGESTGSASGSGTTSESTTESSNSEADSLTTSATGEDTPGRICTVVHRAESTSLIDDFENGPLPRVDGRIGGWFTDNDQTGGEQFPPRLTVVRPTDEDAHGGSHSIHTY